METNSYFQQVKTQTSSSFVASFVSKVYIWMTLALFVTFGIGAALSFLPIFQPWLIFFANYFQIIILVELGVAIGFSLLLEKINSLTAGILFFTYSILNGIFFGILFTVFELSSVMFAFGLTAGLFAVLAVYGHFTKHDLTRYGQIAYAGLFGVILVSLVNIFLRMEGLAAIMNYVVVLIFIALIAYDAQKLKRYALSAEARPEMSVKLALYAAFSLYLDFINLFIRLLSIMGKRK